MRLVVYDLPSENIKGIDKNVQSLIANVRVKSVHALHSLGLQCTESVIIVSDNRTKEDITNTINKVMDYYSRITAITLTPLIEVIELSEEQEERFIPLARRRLINRIDEGIERINRLFSEIDEITEESRLNALKYRLSRIKREYENILDIARELGITDVSADYLIQLIDSLIGRIEERL